MNKKQKFGDVVENHELVKRTLMVAAFPALIKKVERKGVESFEGFLPGFEFAEVKDIETEEELVEVLQDMLDDEVEELIVFGKSLPYVDEDEVLLEKYPDNKIVYLDINVYASKEDLEGCSHDCSCWGVWGARERDFQRPLCRLLFALFLPKQEKGILVIA